MEFSNMIQSMFSECQGLDLLYVEDDLIISKSTYDLLHPFFHSITVAYNGEEGLKAYNEKKFDIVLTDMMMPIMNGRDMTKKIREINPNQAIIVISALEEIDFLRELIDIGISKFISKPPEFHHFLNSFVSTAVNINNAKKVALLTQDLKNDLDEKKELLRRIIDTVPVRIFWKDKNSRYLGCNALYAKDAGLDSPAEIIGKSDYDLAWKDKALTCINDDQEVMNALVPKLEYEEKIVFPDGTTQWLSMSKVPLKGDEQELIGILGTYIDVSEHKKSIMSIQLAKNELGYQAEHDALTGLPNRLLYMDRLHHAIQKAARSESKVAIMFVDLDRFKLVNDTLGHETGDMIVKLLGERLNKVLRKEDTIARFGGDEFTILLEAINDVSDIVEIANKVIQAMDEPFFSNNHHLHLTLSIGISLYPDDGDTAEVLLRNADTAMYRAKEDGRNNYQLYSKDMTEKTLYNMTIAKNIRTALDNNTFEVYYQPQIDANNHTLLGMEALIRWKTAEGFISPAVFIPIAEDAGLIDRIGEFVLTHAASQMVRWYGLGYHPGRIAINLSTIELQKENFVETLLERLAALQCKCEWIELEITEGYTMKHPDEAIIILQKIKDTGIHLSIDDFGTGYSSLSYLQKLPIHKLKIDQTFVRNIPGNIYSEAIVKSIIFLAKSMKFDVIAEGVETVEQQDYLLSKGCYAIQGYLNAKPMPADEMETFLKNQLV